jgi:hypothetical protein
MGLKIEYINGQTALSEEEMEGIKIPSIITRRELDESISKKPLNGLFG